MPHSEHVVRVSGLTLNEPRARFALHCLQCLGSFLNCLSWKNTCSPAVNTKSAPQSTHLSTRSVNSMTGFPHRTISEIGHGSQRTRRSRCPGLFLRTNQGGPDRTNQSRAALRSSPDLVGLSAPCTQPRAQRPPVHVQSLRESSIRPSGNPTGARAACPSFFSERSQKLVKSSIQCCRRDCLSFFLFGIFGCFRHLPTKALQGAFRGG
jgi:hypothetical protein